MKLIYICSPYAGSIEENVRFARAACRYAARQSCAPVAPHLLYPQFLNDTVPTERNAGIEMGLRLLTACDELWVCGSRISEGMKKEIDEAKRLGITVRSVSSQEIESESVVKRFGILARRNAISVCGAAEAWLQRDGKPITFATYEEAAEEAQRLNDNMGPVNRTVQYFPKKRVPMPEETPEFGMKLEL
jgi:hypothetical protein